MNKKIKWGLVAFIGLGLIGWGIYSQRPKLNEELEAADNSPAQQASNKKILNVNGKIIKPESMTDEITVIGTLLPDEEVDLSFETSGKIVEINFMEGSAVKKGQILAKVNDRQLQAELQRLQAQVKLAEDRVYRQQALLKRDAVSQEAYEQVRTDLATLNAEINIVNLMRAYFERSLPKVARYREYTGKSFSKAYASRYHKSYEVYSKLYSELSHAVPSNSDAEA